MKKVNVSRSIFPNTATTLNIISGFSSIIMASQGEFRMAAILIFVAAFFDLADGIIARMTNSSSQFGVQLDSLADAVSFGTAPAFLIYQVHLYQYGLIGIILSSSILIAGVLRLARFNVQLEQISTKLDFKGLPIPIAAVTIASITLFYYNGLNIVQPFASAVIPVIIILSFLMLSNIRYNTIPKVKYLNTSSKLVLFGVAAVALFAVIITEGKAFFYLVLAHIIFGILRYLYYIIFDVNDSNEVKLKEKTN